MHFGESAFRKCSNLTDIILSNEIKELKGCTFYECKSLSELKLPNKLETLAHGVTWNTNISTLKFPASLTSFDTYDQALSLESIDTSENNNFIFENNVLYSKDKTILYFVGANATNVNILTQTTTIKDCAFRNCTKVTSINIPEGVTTIGRLVWNNSITHITVDSKNQNFKITNQGSLVSADGKNLYRCIQTGAVTVDDGVEYIYRSAFLPGITSIKLPDSYKNVSDGGTFPALDELELPKNVESFSYGYYSSIKQIKVNSENTHFKMSEDNNYMTSYDGKKLYWAKKSLITLNIPNSVNEICTNAFFSSSATSLVVPEGVTKIGKNIIAESSIKTIEIPSTVESIDGSAFSSANNLSQIIIHKAKDSITGSPWGAVGGNKIIKWNK